MITENGKIVLGKYLLGQAPSYASYIAIGCGQTPLDINDIEEDFSQKDNLNFEMFRVPISSKGFINENGVNKIVFTAELPTEERYEISEIGIYSAGANPSAGVYDSKTIFAFSQNENWQYSTDISTVGINSFLSPLDSPAEDNIISVIDPVFQANSDNSIFFKTSRSSRYERCRFLNNAIFIQGDTSNITLNEDSGPGSDSFVVENGANHIRISGASIDLSKNSPIDQLRLAFSLVNKDGDSGLVPEAVRVLVEFSSSNNNEYARFEAEVNHGTSGNLGNVEDFNNNRYFVISKELQDLYTTANFTWDAVTVVKIYACVLSEDSGPNPVPSSNYYVALDALRLENIATTNPLYALTGYSIVKNNNAETIIKSPNTSNYVEFRFSVGVS
jgi:hypothetical protein